MYFDATPTNMTEVLVVVLAMVSIVMLMRKRYDSNLPLLFYFSALVFTSAFDRPVDPLVMYGSFAFALLLRFEFLNTAFTKFIAFCTTCGLGLMVYALMSDVLA